MHRRIVTAVLVVLSAGFSYAGGGEAVLSDNFNDNIRNTQLWTPQNTIERFRERNYRLYFDSMGKPSSSTLWQWRMNYSLFDGDTLTARLLVNCPLVNSADPSQWRQIGIGFRDPFSLRFCSLSIRSSGYSRVAVLGGDWLATTGTPLPLPRNVAKSVLVIRYTTLNGKLTAWQEAPDRSWKQKICGVTLAGWWGIPLSPPPTLTPYIVSRTSNMAVTPNDNLFADNFSLVWTAMP
jgi:hypothetical protein